MNGAYRAEEEHPPRDGLTISSGVIGGVTLFALGRGTDVSDESYPGTKMYIGRWGVADMRIGGAEARLKKDDVLIVPPDTPCGASTSDGTVYWEVDVASPMAMNDAVKAGAPIRLADLVDYEKGSIVNMDVVHNGGMKLAVLAFDEGTALKPHSAPGDAILFALEGKADVGYDDGNGGLAHHDVEAGQQFRFAKGGLHSVAAKGRFKMALIIALE